MRPFTAAQTTQILNWLSSQWGLKPRPTGHISRTDASTGTALGIHTFSDDSHQHLLLLGCEASRTALGKQLITGCINHAIIGPDQSVALSWLNTEYASGLPLPASGKGATYHDVGPYHLGFGWTQTGYNLIITKNS